MEFDFCHFQFWISMEKSIEKYFVSRLLPSVFLNIEIVPYNLNFGHFPLKFVHKNAPGNKVFDTQKFKF